MPAKKAKKTATKKPSAKQLAARKKFALAAKARSKNTKGKKRGSLKNGSVTRRKYRNGYLDLVIAGTAQRGPKGWKVGGKEIPYGKGIVPVKAGHYLDKATGTIFTRRERNVASGAYYDGAFHPFRASADYDPAIAGETGGKPQRTRSKKKKAAVKKAIRTAADKKATKTRKATTTRLASRSLFRSTSLKRMPRKKNSAAMSEAQKNREEFAGHYGGMKTVYAPSGTPDGLSRLGVLAALILADKSRLSFREQNTIFLAQDNQHRLHVVSSKPGAIVDNQAGDYGEVSKVEYVEAKPHLGESDPIQWVHKMGEITGERPRLIVDSNGQLKLKGGAYTINWRGIIN